VTHVSQERHTVNHAQTTGIGLDIAHHLAGFSPARIILAVRNMEAGETAKMEILAKAASPKAQVDVWKVDMASLASVKAFAKKCEALERIDGVAMNAGVLGGDWKVTEDGHELV
jgi:retinol dehydrogenase-12